MEKITTIHSSQTLPKRRLTFRSSFAYDPSVSIGELIVHTQYDSARAIADAIIKEPKFYDVKLEAGYGTVTANAIVITEEEYNELCMYHFKKGLEHYRYSTSMWDK